MATPSISVAAATDALRAAGHVITRVSKAVAARRYGCQTCLYVMDGRGVNIGRFRQLALQALAGALAADLATPHPTPGSLRARAVVTADPAQAETLTTWADSIAPAPAGADPWAGQPWDPGTPEARARVALRGERVGTLWPIAQALAGEGVPLPGAWASDGPAMAGEWGYGRALAVLPPGAVARAAAALAALPPVTTAQARALELCRAHRVPAPC